jgi:hypothetical protein
LAGWLLAGWLPVVWLFAGCAASGPPAEGRPPAAAEAEPGRGDPRIRRALEAFAMTGEYRHLCQAALLGSREAAGRLEREGLRCSVR